MASVVDETDNADLEQQRSSTFALAAIVNEVDLFARRYSKVHTSSKQSAIDRLQKHPCRVTELVSTQVVIETWSTLLTVAARLLSGGASTA